ncbi:Phenylpropionate dioxygenase [Enhygromyxa salina]|uniref:Phenylpropionate dioxygenase n=1 Tax=Enhygromyxa salina TaxID=215803 RepID=A0A0C2A0R9_9BACT|nr:aromatic ring-hydroxylating dioxygenase subunit alpha [Enhygromyxa salina]KIG17003.1 Phenylpropionate dioxygenase [Enhygromyxa salina]
MDIDARGWSHRRVFVHDTRLPHVLEPACYHEPSWHERELAAVFRPGWQCVATLDELPREGDYVTRELLGVPLLLRRAGGQVRAFRNVCAHRFAALCSAPKGRAASLRCPYHGWTYADDGALTHIPDPGSFASPPGKPALIGRVKLTAVEVACAGQLVFVSLAKQPPPLAQWLGARTHALATRLFSTDYQRVLARSIEHPCNWKIPIENVLETYHVAELHSSWLARHPRLVPVFGEPSAEQHEHELGDGFSEYRDSMGAGFAPYRALVRALVGDTACHYQHHHAFPNLVVAHTPVLSFLQVVTPTGPQSSRSMIRLYLHRGAPPRAWTAPLRSTIGAAASWFLNGVLREDAAIYPAVQTGVQGSERSGVLGAKEERVWAFQRWLADQLAVTTP